MFRRANLMATGMLGMGALLGYAAAWGNLSVPAWGADERAQSPPADKAKCCPQPDKKTSFTSFQAGRSGEGEAAIQKNAEAFVEAFHKGNAKALAALWTADGEYTQGQRELLGYFGSLGGLAPGAN